MNARGTPHKAIRQNNEGQQPSSENPSKTSSQGADGSILKDQIEKPTGSQHSAQEPGESSQQISEADSVLNSKLEAGKSLAFDKRTEFVFIFHQARKGHSNLSSGSEGSSSKLLSAQPCVVVLTSYIKAACRKVSACLFVNYEIVLIGSDIGSVAGKDTASNREEVESPARSAAGEHWDEEDELEDYLKRKLATSEASKSPVSGSRAGGD